MIPTYGYPLMRFVIVPDYVQMLSSVFILYLTAAIQFSWLWKAHHNIPRYRVLSI